MPTASLPELRPLPEVEYVDPRSLQQDLDGVRELCVLARYSPECPNGYVDGYRVYSGIPRDGRTYQEINRKFLENRDQIGFSPLAFYNEYFDASHVVAEVPHMAEGETTEAYLDRMDTVLWRHMPEDIGPHKGLPYGYPIPGSRFIHNFPHDNFGDAIGKMAVGKFGMAQDIIDNDAWQIKRYEYPWNANAEGFEGRTQNPFSSYTVEHFAHAFGEHGQEVVRHYRPVLERYFNFFLSGIENLAHLQPGQYGAHRRVVRMPGGEILFRNYDDTNIRYNIERMVGGRRESESEDVEVVARAIFGIRDKDEQVRKATFVIRSIMAACEGCWDMCATRQFTDVNDMATTRTLNVVPVDLNANMVHMARMIAVGYHAEGNVEMAVFWGGRAGKLAAAMRKYMLREVDDGHAELRDCLLDGTQTDAVTVAMNYALAAGGIFNFKEALKIGRSMRKHKLLAPYGFRTSTINTPQQWDGDAAWGTPNKMSVEGYMLAAMDAKQAGDEAASRELLEIAEEGREGFVSGIESFLARHRRMPEKTHAFRPAQILVRGEYGYDDKNGEPDLPVGFGMTNGTYRDLKARDLREPYDYPETSHRRLTIAQANGSLAMLQLV